MVVGVFCIVLSVHAVFLDLPSLPLFQSQIVSLSERGFQADASIRGPFVRLVSLFMLKFRIGIVNGVNY